MSSSQSQRNPLSNPRSDHWWSKWLNLARNQAKVCGKDRGIGKSVHDLSSLTGNRVNPQKKTFHADKQESEAVKQLRLEYQLMMWAIETNNLVFIDESRTNLNMARTYARSKKGTRVHGCKPHNKGENLTIIAAISITGVIAALTVSLHRAVFRQIPIFQMASNSLF